MMEWISKIESEHVGLASVILAIIAFIAVYAYCKKNKIEITLQELIVRSLSASALPTAVIILICSIDLSLIMKLGGLLQVYIALAGLSLVYVSLSGLFGPFETKRRVTSQKSLSDKHDDENG